jgi:3-oxoacyl-[acyl-carrier protein] reductase
MKRLQDRVAIVTGAAKGIGRGIAERLSAEGAVVVVADLDDTKGREMAEALSAGGSRAAFQHVDVSDPASVTAMVRTTIERFGRLDIQVSNAGITNRAAFLDYPLDDWNEVLRVNLTGCFLCGQAAARAMKDKGGRIVNISSVSGQAGGMGRAAYGASKAGIINLTQTMAMELAPHGITVNAIAPGPTQVERTAHGPAQREAFMRRMAIKRYGKPSDIAAAAAYLASDDADFVTGHVLNVDGGFHAAGVLFEAGEKL